MNCYCRLCFWIFAKKAQGEKTKTQAKKPEDFFLKPNIQASFSEILEDINQNTYILSKIMQSCSKTPVKFLDTC